MNIQKKLTQRRLAAFNIISSSKLTKLRIKFFCNLDDQGIHSSDAGFCCDSCRFLSRSIIENHKGHSFNGEKLVLYLKCQFLRPRSSSNGCGNFNENRIGKDGQNLSGQNGFPDLKSLLMTLLTLEERRNNHRAVNRQLLH